MIDNLRRIREPITWAVLAIVSAGLVLGVVRLVLLLTLEKRPVFAAFQDIGLSLMNLTLVAVLVGLVCACLFVAPATPRAGRMARIAAWVVTIGTLLSIVCWGFGIVASVNAFAVVLELVGALLDVFLKAVAAGALWVISRGVNQGRLDPAAAPPPPEVEQSVSPEPESRAAPTWRADEATGTVWRTADEAAAGEGPSGAGHDNGRGWVPWSEDAPGATEGEVEPAPKWRPVERKADSDTD